MNVPLFVTVLTLIACVSKLEKGTVKDEKLNEVSISPDEKENKPQIVIIDSSSYWFESWGGLRTNCFIGYESYPLNMYWNHIPLDFKASILDSFLISYKYHVDIYTYNTIIQYTSDSIIVNFGIDSEAYLFNPKLDSMMLLLHTSGFEVIEDAEWIDEMNILVLGYETDESEFAIPVIWHFNITEGIGRRYKYKIPVCKAANRSRYFISKYYDASSHPMPREGR